jgi:lipoate-protein ligase A
MHAKTTSASCRSSHPGEGWRLPFLELEGPEQMALDRWLLERSLQQAESGPVLRFYGWRGPWLSLGRHQGRLPEHWHAMAAAGSVSLVRRPSGGGAVLHAGGLTYALIWPQAPRRRRQAYGQTAAWLMDGFRRLGYTLRCGEQASEAGASDCFATASPADLVDALGQKRIGSAQYWRHGHLLQHGEILIEPPPQLWIELFGGPAPDPLPGLSRKQLIQALQTSLEERWDPLRWIDKTLMLEEGELNPYRLETRPT